MTYRVLSTILPGLCGGLALLSGHIHLFIAWAEGTRDPFHLDSIPPGPREFGFAAINGCLGVTLVIGAILALCRSRHARGGLLVIACAAGVDELLLLNLQITHRVSGLATATMALVGMLGLLSVVAARKVSPAQVS